MGFSNLIALGLLLCGAVVANSNHENEEQLRHVLSEILESYNSEQGVQRNKKYNCNTRGSFASLEYLFMGYNVLFGFPLSSNRDPGFTMGIFKADASDPQYTADCSYLIPKGVLYSNGLSCKVDFSSTEIRSEKQFSESLQMDANVAGSGWGVSFSASVGYKQAVDKMSNSNSILIVSNANCNYYNLKLDVGIPPPLSDSFLATLRDLQSSDPADEREKYTEFFNNYGTHYLREITYGARYTKVHEMSQEAYQEASQSSYSISAQASYEGLYSVSGGMSMSSEQKKAASNFQKNVKTTTSTVGAVPVASGNSLEWASSVKKSPMPMKFKLASIEGLFSSKFFAGVTDVDYSSIKSKITQYKMEYCEELRSRGMVDSCEAVQDVNECASSPCQNGGTCVDGEGRFFCQCPQGLYGDRCTEFSLSYFASPCGKQTYSFNRGKEICDDNGMRMATDAEVRFAWGKGYNKCDCGWVAEGYALLPVHTVAGCYTNNRVDHCNWRTQWDVFCMPK